MNEGTQASGVQIPIDIPGLRPIRLLGEGGMARVYLAEQHQPKRQIVVKIVSPESVPARFMEVLKSEGDTAAQFEHDNLITIHACGVIDDHYYQVMPYLAGGDLGDRIGEGLTRCEAVSIIRAIASALDHIHERGFIHRDIKPGNILFTDSGKPVLADFGIAKAVNTVGVLTEAGYATGTPAYMSPEQVLGNPLDARSDLYSLGVVLYEALTGSAPFEADSDHQLKQAHVSAPIPRLPKTLAPLQPILDRLLAKHPDDRYPDARTLLEDLDGLPSISAAESPGPSSGKTTSQPPGYASVTTWVREMSRRRVFRVMAIYIAVAWGFTEIFTTVSETLAWPDWTRTTVVVLFILGFPVAMLLSWLFDVGPDGVYRASPSSHKGMAAIFASMAVVIAVTAMIVVSIDTKPTDERTDDGYATSDAVAVGPAPNSIAVLPFGTCSDDPDGEVVATAMAADLIDRLAESRNLKVIARSSSFAFPGPTYDIPQVAEALNVSHILTGILCRKGNELRLDQELMDPAGFVAASESFPLGASGTSETALGTAAVADWVAEQMGVSVSPEMRRACQNLEAYQLYLVGREYLGRDEFDQAQAYFERALERQPDCADALAGLAESRAQWMGAPPTGYASIIEAQQAVAQEAVAMDPDSEYAAAVLSNMMRRGNRQAAAERFLKQSIARRPSSALLHARLASLLADQERFEEAEKAAREAVALDPVSTDARLQLGRIFASQHRISDEVRVLQEGIQLDPLNVELLMTLAWAHHGRGEYHQAMRTFERMRALPRFPPNAWRSQLIIAYWSGRLDKAIELALEMLENGGADLGIDYVRREICYASTALGVLGLFEEMNRWMSYMDQVAGIEDTLLEFNLIRLVALGEHDTAAQLAHQWLERLGGELPAPIQNTRAIPFVLVSVGEYDAAISLIEQTITRDGKLGSSLRLPLAAAYEATGRHSEAHELIEAALADIPEQEERIFSDGWRPPRHVFGLADDYVLAGRHDDALDTLEIAVDKHFRARWRASDGRFWAPPLPNFQMGQWQPVAEDPRFLELVGIMHEDLDRQARQVEGLLGERDWDELFADLVE